VLCCAVLCAVLCCAVLCCAVLCCAVLCCALQVGHSHVSHHVFVGLGVARAAGLAGSQQHQGVSWCQARHSTQHSISRYACMSDRPAHTGALLMRCPD
jgi:hypothetical protein